MLHKNKGKQFISDLKFYSDYAKWRDHDSRYETWPEACSVVMDTHRVKYGHIPAIHALIDEAEESYKNKLILASQRNLQFRGPQVLSKNERMFNCSTGYMDKIDTIHKSFFLTLCGCGVGLNMLKRWTTKLPRVLHRDVQNIKNFIIPDSIEGWADAGGVLISSYCEGEVPFPEYQNSIVRFDYSNIRPEGSFISGGFKAPGPAGLKQSLERIEALLELELQIYGEVKMRPIVAYDILMHLADATLSGGVRRSAVSVIVDPEDEEMINAKTGDWREKNPQRGRSNNSVGLRRGEFSYDRFADLVKLNSGMSDIGFVFMNNDYEVFNPCFEVGMTPIYDIEKEITGFEFCNLVEGNAKACMTNDKLDRDKFLAMCRSAAIVATLQAGYTDYPYMGKITEEIVRKESLIGVGITGWMDNPELFDASILEEGAKVVKETNAMVADIIGINPAARTTVVKPSGNASVLLGCASGIHPEHSKRYFRNMQLNKKTETAKWLAENMADILEDSHYSAMNTDWVVSVPIENSEVSIFKNDISSIEHLEKIRLVQNHWIKAGRVEENCIFPTTMNNVSCTVIVDDYDNVSKYVYDNQDDFTAVSFLSDFGDKDYTQAPFTSVLTSEELLSKYGDAVIFASGLIVDGLHYFEDDLWAACEAVLDKNRKVEGTRTEVLLKKDWIRRAKQFAKNYFRGDTQKCIYCLKDVHLWYKWNKISKSFKEVDFQDILRQPEYNDVSKYTAQACSGGACEIV